MRALRLIEPTAALEKEYLSMLSEWTETGEKLIPFVLKMNPSDFPAMIQKLNNYSQGVNIPQSFVPHATYWLVNETNRIFGVVNIRPRLNESLLRRGGHIGYGIRPGERRKGYATEILRLALEELKLLAVERALLTCDKENIGSAKKILKNGGKLENEEVVDGVAVQRYWIEIG